MHAIGRAGRDGHQANVLLLRRKGRQYINQKMKVYCDNESKCRREVRLEEDDIPKQSVTRLCLCCNICRRNCTRGSCKAISGCIDFHT